jgi:4-amino-4-deoxy-L-arabinose transferase-like glycosyltransferase
MKTRLFDHPNFYYVLFAILLVPALLINLGSHHIFIHTDEGRRALVALEMILSNQYLAPTLNGEFYYEKPPLFNWLLVLSFKAFGAYSTFAIRFPVVLFTMLFGFVIHYFLRPILGSGKAWIVLIATITSGRILFYDSFLGLIDIGFSILVFVNFMLFFKLGREKRYALMFFGTYFVAAVAYLMKGMPAIVFQFFTILAIAAFQRDWKLIFHKYNFIGTLFFIMPVGVYYYFSEQVNPDSLLTVFEYTWHQSSQRTVTDHGIWPAVVSSFVFPFEQLYHFAPWTILLVAVFRKGALRTLWQMPFTRFAILAFALNIVVYWTSPGVHPRYLFMFLPLLFAILVEAFFESPERLQGIIYRVLFVVMGIATAFPVVMWILPASAQINGATAKALVVLFGLLAFLLVYWKKPDRRFIILGCFLLVLRIGFDWFLLPNRDIKGQGFADAAEEVVSIVGEDEVYVLRPKYCHDGTSFIISSARGEILEERDLVEAGAYYILHDDAFDPKLYDSFLEFGTRGTPQKLHLVKLKE